MPDFAPPSLAGSFRAMARNNAWCNHRLLAAVATLDQAAFAAHRVGFFPSLRRTLNHILIIDHFYVDALEGGALGPAAWANQEPCATIAGLRAAQSAVDRRLIAHCDALTDASLGREIRVHRGQRFQAERQDRLLLHLFLLYLLLYVLLLWWSYRLSCSPCYHSNTNVLFMHLRLQI